MDNSSFIFFIVSKAIIVSLLVRSGNGEFKFFLNEYMNWYNEHVPNSLSKIC